MRAGAFPSRVGSGRLLQVGDATVRELRSGQGAGWVGTLLAGVASSQSLSSPGLSKAVGIPLPTPPPPPPPPTLPAALFFFASANNQTSSREERIILIFKRH